MWQKERERGWGREVLLPGCLHTGFASWGLTGRSASWKLTLGTAGKFALPCVQVALVCRAMPALFGPLKTHSFTLPGFTLRTCSTLLLLKRTFSRQSLARKKIFSVPCPCVFLTHFCGSVSCLENRKTSWNKECVKCALSWCFPGMLLWLLLNRSPGLKGHSEEAGTWLVKKPNHIPECSCWALCQSPGNNQVLWGSLTRSDKKKGSTSSYSASQCTWCWVFKIPQSSCLILPWVDHKFLYFPSIL